RDPRAPPPAPPLFGEGTRSPAPPPPRRGPAGTPGAPPPPRSGGPPHASRPPPAPGRRGRRTGHRDAVPGVHVHRRRRFLPRVLLLPGRGHRRPQRRAVSGGPERPQPVALRDPPGRRPGRRLPRLRQP